MTFDTQPPETSTGVSRRARARRNDRDRRSKILGGHGGHGDLAVTPNGGLLADNVIAVSPEWPTTSSQYMRMPPDDVIAVLRMGLLADNVIAVDPSRRR